MLYKHELGLFEVFYKLYSVNKDKYNISGSQIYEEMIEKFLEEEEDIHFRNAVVQIIRKYEQKEKNDRLLMESNKEQREQTVLMEELC